MTRRIVLPLDRQCAAAGLPVPVTEYGFDPERRFRFDYAWIGRLLAAEVDGGTWINGRHSRHAGVEADCEKVNLAIARGWRVARFTTDMVNDGRALATLALLLTLETHGQPTADDARAE